MKVGSLFSGIGGIDLGLQWAGMETIWFVEQDQYCQKVLAKHWPEVPCYGDITEVDFRGLPGVDLLCGGFPCQPVSVAGKRKGDADKRWLWPEMFKAICTLRPKFAVIENVPGLLDRGLAQVLCDLAKIRYDAEWETIPAYPFGSPQLRFRIFIVSYPAGKFSDGKIFQTHKERSPQKQLRNSCSNIRRDYRGLWGLEPESRVVRMADGISDIVHRLKCLGNAVVPQCAEWIGNRIIEADCETQT